MDMGSRLVDERQPEGHGDFDDDNENDLEGDDTERLDRRDTLKCSSENVLALQRVKSLTERNRMALDKLSSISRLSTPSPSGRRARAATPDSRSSAPSHASSTSSSRLSNPPRQLRALPPPPPLQRRDTLSGSETERESTSMHSYSSSHHHSASTSSHSSRRPITPPPPGDPSTAVTPFRRHRNTSAPGSPDRARTLSAATLSSGSNLSNSPSRRRKRTSMANMSFDEGDSARYDTITGTARERSKDTVRDITESALAAVASSRRSPLGTRKRAALPKEFRGETRMTDDHGGDQSRTNHRRRGSLDGGDKRREGRLSLEPMTPYRTTNGVGRSSTVRELRRNGAGTAGRWGSDDYRSIVSSSTAAVNDDAQKERRQSLRGGSAESALGLWSPGGRSLIGEGLRAAGLTRKEEHAAEVFKDRRVEWSPHDIDDDGRRRVLGGERERERPPRASTSMADYRYSEHNEEPPGRPGLRGHRSTYSLVARDKERDLSLSHREPSLTRTEREQLDLDRAASSLSRHSGSNNVTPAPPPTPSTNVAPATATPQHMQQERYERFSTASPFGTKRFGPPTPVLGGSFQQTEHTKLMLDSLTMFESHLAKIPHLPPSSGTSSSDLARNAQNVVYAAERLNGLLRLGTSRAMEAQVGAEVDDSTGVDKEVAEVWRRVGAEYREGVRAADDLVRGVTGFLLGMGKVVRDFTASEQQHGSPSVHGRSVSLNDEDLRARGAAGSPDVAASTSTGSGRRSVLDSRKSWEPRDRDRDREEALRRLGAGRAESSLARSSPFQATRDLDTKQFETPPPHGRATQLSSAAPPSGSVRRLFTPREQREHQMDAAAANGTTGRLGPSDSQRTLTSSQDYEPSPTPASRTRDQPLGRSRTLPPLTLPKPLAVLPSESRKANVPVSTPADKGSSVRDRERRPRVSLASISTVRGSVPTFPGLTTPSSATTALTAHTVSTNSPASPLVRTDSNKPARSTMTFSRPSAVSVSAALSGLQQQHLDDERKRTVSTSAEGNSISDSAVHHHHPSAPLLNKSISTSAVERDRDRRKTLGTARKTFEGDDDAGTLSYGRGSTANAADRSAASTILPQHGNGKRERRRTVTDIWPRP